MGGVPDLGTAPIFLKMGSFIAFREKVLYNGPGFYSEGERIMEQRKKRRGDRKDGWLLKDLPGMNKFIAHLYPNRTDNEAFVNLDIDVRPIDAYLAKKNEGKTEDKYTYFHLISAAMGRAFVLRPRMNRFVANNQIYERKYISMAFIVKKKFEDKAEEGLAFQYFDENSTLDGFHTELMQTIHKTRRTDEKDASMSTIDKVMNLPKIILRPVMRICFFLDRHGWIPHSVSSVDPTYSSIFISNLGSIGLECGYHHLTNWGTNSCFVIIGKKRMVMDFDKTGKPDPHEVIPLGITLDERIADGYYYSGTAALVKELLEHPWLLEEPAGTPVEYSIRR